MFGWDVLAMEIQSESINRRKLFLAACRSEPVERIPVWIMRQAGRYLPGYRAIRQRHPFLEVCKTPELAVEVSLQPFFSLKVDAVIVFSDILIPAEAMGMELLIGDDGPILPRPIRTKEDVHSLRSFDPEVETRFLLDTIRELSRTLGHDVPVLGFAAAPWTLACYLIEGRTKTGYSLPKKFAYEQPESFHQLLAHIAMQTAAYLRAQMAAGATAVQLFDTWAGDLSLDDYERFALPATQMLIDEIDAGDTPVILYTKASSHLIPAIARTGAKVLSVDWRVDLADTREQLGRRIALQGNLDPSLLLGPISVIAPAVEAAIGKTKGIGHILNLGHGILPSTPVENALAFVQAAQSASTSAQSTPIGNLR